MRSVFVIQRVGIFHLALYDEKQFLGVILAHFILACFFDDVVNDFFQVDFNAAIVIGLRIENAALGVILVNQVEEVVELVVRELVFQFLRQVAFDEFDSLFIIEVILQKVVFLSPIIYLLEGETVIVHRVRLRAGLPVC